MTHCRELSIGRRRGAYVFGRLTTFLFWLLQGFCCLCLCFCLRCAAQITSNQSCDTFFIFLCCYCCLQLLRPKIKAKLASSSILLHSRYIYQFGTSNSKIKAFLWPIHIALSLRHLTPKHCFLFLLKLPCVGGQKLDHLAIQPLRW